MPLSYTSKFVNEVKHGHTIRSQVQILVGGIANSTVLKCTQGTIKEDSTIDIRTQFSGTFVDPTGVLVPSQINDLLYPGVNEIKCYRGVVYADGTSELLPLGVFGYEEVDIHDSGEKLSIAIQGFDRSKKVANARFTDLYNVATATSIADAIVGIVSPRIPNLQTNFVASAYTQTVNTTTFDRGDDPWAACNTLAAVGGFEVFFDRDGVLIIRNVPSITADPKWSFLDGSQSVVVEINKSLTIPQYNHVYEIAEGGSIATPFYGEARDNWSITNTGDRPTFHVSSLYTSQAQAQAAANAKIQQVRGTLEGLDLQIVPNPAISSGDVVQTVSARTKTSSLSIVDKVTTPLEATNGQYLGVRKRTVD